MVLEVSAEGAAATRRQKAKKRGSAVLSGFVLWEAAEPAGGLLSPKQEETLLLVSCLLSGRHRPEKLFAFFRLLFVDSSCQLVL